MARKIRSRWEEKKEGEELRVEGNLPSPYMHLKT